MTAIDEKKLDVALQCISRGRYNKASEILDLLLQTNPNDVGVLLAKAGVSSGCDSVYYYDLVLRQEPTNYNALWGRGIGMANAGNNLYSKEEWLPYYKQALECCVDNWVDRMEIERVIERYEQAGV